VPPGAPSALTDSLVFYLRGKATRPRRAPLSKLLCGYGFRMLSSPLAKVVSTAPDTRRRTALNRYWALRGRFDSEGDGRNLKVPLLFNQNYKKQRPKMPQK
jgi:hypothetical protein